ncbi:class I SAM-dependent methyltransferase [Andreprevotia chitinilytica]|uniref:class I SAM-dependent methyltransferase n=1 Tax=Andreprevotia chitinilytica TaxID=396808 RepID=UPI000690325E|nr:class I SAM-dependent methyltransferase [Andreprevotia chitinilytica]
MDNKKLIDWKTDAWKDHGMVAWYAQRMVGNQGTNRLKNRVEVGLCERFAVGRDLLDVGVGTGRASLPLARKGMQLTGVDSSQAMLDECGRQAGNMPVRLLPGDVQKLPLPDHAFDTLISLNVMTHFPHVENVLKEWKRVVRPDGRIIFDIYSLDHLCYNRRRDVTLDDLIAQGPERFSMHLKAAEIVEIANRLDLAIVAVVPYGSAFSGEYQRPGMATPLQFQNWWGRQLDWIANDDSLLDLAYFLDTEWFGRLPLLSTGRFMAVLECRRDPEGNARWMQQQEQKTVLLGQKLDEDCLRQLLEAPQPNGLDTSLAQWRERFASHLGGARNRVFAYMLLSSFLQNADALSFEALAGAELGAVLQGWLNAESRDRDIAASVTGWHRQNDFSAALNMHDVDLGTAIEYELLRTLNVAGQREQAKS